MLRRIRPRFNHATIVAYLALFVALGGGGALAATDLAASGEIHACVNDEGQLTVIKAGATCGNTSIKLPGVCAGRKARRASRGLRGSLGRRARRG